ncbi:MAG: diadenylate cyclase [Lentisphaeria bacterium]|nr:diadenylate cyclase [Lentisphaeria bacterium]
MPNQDVIVKYLFYSVDFVIIWAMIYWVLYFLRGTRSANVLFGVIAVLLTATILVSRVERLTVLRFLLIEGLIPSLGIAILVIFQPEFRRAFAQAGSIFVSNRIGQETIDQVAEAAAQLSVTRTGAIIVFERNIGLTDTTRSAVSLDARVDALLLQSIFYPNSPLHDCAVVIGKNNRIVAAHAVLPLAEEDFFVNGKRLGTRHRAAVGISQETDAVAVVVSEETGLISLAKKGRLIRGLSAEELRFQLSTILLERKKAPWKRFGKAAELGLASPDDAGDDGGKDGEA